MFCRIAGRREKQTRHGSNTWVQEMKSGKIGLGVIGRLRAFLGAPAVRSSWFFGFRFLQNNSLQLPSYLAAVTHATGPSEYRHTPPVTTTGAHLLIAEHLSGKDRPYLMGSRVNPDLGRPQESEWRPVDAASQTAWRRERDPNPCGWKVAISFINDASCVTAYDQSV